MILGGVPAAQSATSVRVFYEGSLDTTYNTPAGANNGADDAVYAVSLQSGKGVIGGRFTSYQGIPRNMLARLYLDGSLDSGYFDAVGTAANSTDYPARGPPDPRGCTRYQLQIPGSLASRLAVHTIW